MGLDDRVQKWEMKKNKKTGGVCCLCGGARWMESYDERTYRGGDRDKNQIEIVMHETFLPLMNERFMSFS